MKYRLRYLFYITGLRLPFISRLQTAFYHFACWTTAKVLSRTESAAAVYVGGSYARGDLEPGWSDLDFVLVLQADGATFERDRKRALRNFRWARYVFPVLEKTLPVYALSEVVRYRNYLMPLLAPPAGRRIYCKSRDIEMKLDVPCDAKFAALTIASDLWKKKCLTLDATLPRLFCQHVEHSIGNRLEAILVASASGPVESDGVVNIPDLRWTVGGALYEDFLRLGGARPVSIFPALDFLEDVPVEQMLTCHFNVVLHGGKLTARPPTGATVYGYENGRYFPLSKHAPGRIKTPEANPLFHKMSEVSKVSALPHAKNAFALPAGPLKIRKSLREINRTFLNNFVTNRSLFRLGPSDFNAAAEKLRMVSEEPAITQNFEIGPAPSATPAQFFAMQAVLTNTAPAPMPTTSVIVITRDRRESCLATLVAMAQMTTYPDELIVVDNGSSDGTRAMVESFDAPFKIVYVCEPRIGIPRARNAGLKFASGEVITFCDDDCIVEPDWLEKITLPFRYDPSIGCVGGKVVHGHGHGHGRSLVNRFYGELYRSLESAELV